ncbi:S-layer homology domain-containing protein [Paenibacillus agricola]|uniref:S-layer homology domain-containing protein n=1 Tax=Paenibacillus agricola TaxID=2716264 RepID=A0ABX0JGF2_9BACL|nr:S-layer homology domain-containing protein [Paenibacillus agricola]NHN34866.1 S-layer homology domain-containing protein [Paenibacillus agricola]
MKKSTKWFASVVVTCTMLSTIILMYAAAVPLTDTSNHWAESTIKWAQENEVVDGYPDGSFLPDKQITEAEFLGMFSKAYGIKPVPNNKMNHWADAIYDFAKQQNYPMNGFADAAIRNEAINRQKVAEIIVGSVGYNFTSGDAIQYLLAKGYSSGKDSATIEGYKGADSLTRAEAIHLLRT